MSRLEDLHLFWDQCEDSFADIEFFGDDAEAQNLLTEHLGLELEELSCFAQTSNGSLYAVWDAPNGAELIVYIDAELEPISVLAPDGESFLALLLLDSGVLYDILRDPELAVEDEAFVGVELQSIYTENSRALDGWDAYQEWCDEQEIEPLENPAELILDTISENPDFKSWLIEAGVEGLDDDPIEEPEELDIDIDDDEPNDLLLDGDEEGLEDDEDALDEEDDY